MNQRFVTYQLSPLLPISHHLVLNLPLSVLTMLDGCEMAAQEQFTDNEHKLLALLLARYPAEVSYGELLALHSGEPLEQCRLSVKRAERDGELVQLLSPMRKALSSARRKLHLFGVDIKSVLGTSYQLRAYDGSENGANNGE